MLTETDKSLILLEAENDVKRMEDKFNSIAENLFLHMKGQKVVPNVIGEERDCNVQETGSKPKVSSQNFDQVSSSRGMKVFCYHNRHRKVRGTSSSRSVRTPQNKNSDRNTRSYSQPALTNTSKKMSAKTKKSHFAKLKVAQPYKLRQPNSPEGIKKIFGFGSFVKIQKEKEKQSIFLPKRSWREPGWRTFMRRQRKQIANKETLTSFNPSNTGKEVTKKKTCKGVRSFSSALTTDPSTRSQVPSFNYQPSLMNDGRALVAYMTGRPIPFVACRSTSRSFNLRLSIQEIMSLIKTGDKRLARGRRDVIRESTAHSPNSGESLCPAMGSRAIDFPSNAEDVWGRSSVTARCLCFPASQCGEPPLLQRYTAWVSQFEPPELKRYTDWRYQGDSPNTACTDNRSGSVHNSVQGHVDGLKKDWNIINGRLCTLLNDRSMNQKQRKGELDILEPQFEQRVAHYNEIQVMLKEVKEMKARLAGWRQTQVQHIKQKPQAQLTRVLRRIHSTL